MSVALAAKLLASWARWAEAHWYPLPGRPGLGCWGSGYNSWGVQTNQKYLGAMAALAARAGAGTVDRGWARDRALAALRFSLNSHLSGQGECTDGTRWGHTWISALGIERMMHGVRLLDSELADADRDALRRVLVSEADWLLSGYERGQAREICGDPWNGSGRNHPESNIWNGALLWRAARMYPDHPHAAEWVERAHRFLIAGVSLPADAADQTVLAGRPVRERFAGANFFPNCALDHHGYLNVGYMAICLSNAAMLHFDMKLANLARPESLDWHQPRLWAALRRMIYADGRLARVGGDSRVRYAYCQEYLLPVLLYAADRLGDPHALGLAAAQLELVRTEAEHSADGSFYGRRLAHLAAANSYYYTRIESDRACALGQYLAYRPAVAGPPAPGVPFEESVAGDWAEPEHGAMLHRSPRRLAAYAWRAHGVAQGTCQPPGDGHLSDWEANLTGRVEFVSAPQPPRPAGPGGRRLAACRQDSFAGGFVTAGSVVEGAEVALAEGWAAKDLAVHHIAFAALPDGRTCVGLELCRLSGRRGLLRSVRGLGFNLANDLYNGFARRLVTTAGELTLSAPPEADGAVGLGSRWLCIEERIGIAGIYGAEELALFRSRERRGGAFRSLYVEEVCWPCLAGPRWFDAGAVLLDCGWAALSAAGADETRSLTEDRRTRRIETPAPALRAVSVPGADGRQYLLLANFGTECAEFRPSDAWTGEARDLVTGERFANGGGGAGLSVAPGAARLLTPDPG